MHMFCDVWRFVVIRYRPMSFICFRDTLFSKTAICPFFSVYHVLHKMSENDNNQYRYHQIISALTYNARRDVMRIGYSECILKWKCFKINYVKISSVLWRRVFNSKIWLNLFNRETASGEDTNVAVATADKIISPEDDNKTEDLKRTSLLLLLRFLPIVKIDHSQNASL